MLSALPDRPLTESELESLALADAVGFALPATPNSLRDEADGASQVHDILISTGETVSAVAYAADEGWIVVEQPKAGGTYEAAVDAIIEYRDYDVEAEETVRAFVSELFETVAAADDTE